MAVVVIRSSCTQLRFDDELAQTDHRH